MWEGQEVVQLGSREYTKLSLTLPDAQLRILISIARSKDESLSSVDDSTLGKSRKGCELIGPDAKSSASVGKLCLSSEDQLGTKKS